MAECKLPKLEVRVRFPLSAVRKEGVTPIRCNPFFFYNNVIKVSERKSANPLVSIFSRLSAVMKI